LIVGVLALQGDFVEHIQILKLMKIDFVEVRNKNDLEKCSALIIPGGESTVIAKFLSTTGLDKEIKKRVKSGMPIYGTCAGAIILAKKVVGEKKFEPLGLIDVEIKRNAYGRQIDSFEAEMSIENKKINGVFIRAPIISKIGKKVEVLIKLDKKPVLVKQGNILIGTFHPESEGITIIHRLFLDLILTITS